MTLYQLNRLAVSSLWSDPVFHGCNQSERSRRCCLVSLVAAMANWVTSQHTHYHSYQLHASAARHAHGTLVKSSKRGLGNAVSLMSILHSGQFLLVIQSYQLQDTHTPINEYSEIGDKSRNKQYGCTTST